LLRLWLPPQTLSLSLLHKLSSQNKNLQKSTMNNRKGSKEMMSNRRTKKTMRNMMVANWIHNLPKNDAMSLNRCPQSIIKLQWCSIFGVWNCWTKLEAPPFENWFNSSSQTCFESNLECNSGSQTNLKLDLGSSSDYLQCHNGEWFQSNSMTNPPKSDSGSIQF